MSQELFPDDSSDDEELEQPRQLDDLLMLEDVVLQLAEARFYKPVADPHLSLKTELDKLLKICFPATGLNFSGSSILPIFIDSNRSSGGLGDPW
jgi:hypothetical protein